MILQDLLWSIWFVFGILKWCKVLRISQEEEKKGLDQTEHTGRGYSMAWTYFVRPGTVMPNDDKHKVI